MAKTTPVVRTGETLPLVHLAGVGQGPLAAPMASTKCWLNMISSRFSAAFEVVAGPATCPTCTKV